MRTQEEIVERYEERKDGDLFGFECGEYIAFMDFRHARPYLKSSVKARDWHPLTSPRDAMVNYMPFAWEKANNFRGISAARSLCHYTAWLWLDGDDNLWPTLENYQYYGKPQLVSICQYLSLDPSTWDDGVRQNSESG